MPTVSRPDVVVVPARSAYPKYLRYSGYFCQAGRAFRDVDRIAFYDQGWIRREVPRILDRRDEVAVSESFADQLAASSSEENRAIARVIREMLAEAEYPSGSKLQFFMLSSQNDADTILLPHPIRNTATSASGRRTAWTQSQRYTRLDALEQTPRTTSELEALGG